MSRTSTIASVDRALTLLEYLAQTGNKHGVRELAEALKFSRSTTQRLLQTLNRRGFVMQDPETQKYCLGMKAIEIGLAGLARLELVDIARPYLERLTRLADETVFLAVEDSGEIVYLYKVEGTRSVRTSAVLGSRKPMHCTALGKAILAALSPNQVDEILDARRMAKLTENTKTSRRSLHKELSLVRGRGYATDHEETEEGLCCVAAPIRNHTGKVIAAISVAGPSNRMLPNEAQLIEMAQDTASDISTRIGFFPSAIYASLRGT